MKSVALIIILLLSNCGAIQFSKSPHVNIDDHLKIEANQARSQKNYARAASLYHDLYIAQKDQKYLLSSADCYRLSHDCDKANLFYQQIIDQNNEEFLDAAEGKSLCYLESGQYQNAVALFKEIIAIDVTRWKTLNALAVVFAMNKHYSEAVNYFDIALEFTDSTHIILNNKALTLAMWGKLDQAIQTLELALNDMSNSTSAKEKINLNLAMFYSINGKFSKAEEICKKYFAGEKLYSVLSFYAKLAKNKKLASEYLSKSLSP
jgi:Flp pilus assembly protein TadD